MDCEYIEQDICIPVPYDPNIPGVRCIDAVEEAENVTTGSDLIAEENEGEVIELQQFGTDISLADNRTTQT